MDWQALRDDYPSLERVDYLNSCSLGALSRQCRDAHARFLDEWTDLGASAWYERWLEEIEAWRKAVARLLGAKPREIAWTYSTAAGLGSLVSALDRQNVTGDGSHAGRHVTVASDLEFPSTMSAWGVGSGRRVEWVHGDRVQTPVERYEEALATHGDDVQAVVASSVFYATGAAQPVQAIAKAARGAGALSVVDDYHGSGQLPIDVHDAQVDVLTGGPLKWVCGGPVSAWMYVREGLIDDLEPQVAGWWADEGMFDFELEDFRWWPDARRFEQGTVNLHGVFMARAALDRINGLGQAAIRDRVRELASDLEERLEDAGFRLRSHPDPDKRTGIVMVEHDDPTGAVARLAKGTLGAADPAERPTIVDHRPGCVRVSPHFYNTTQENERFVDRLKA